MARAQTADVQLGELLRLVAREKEIDETKWVTAIEDAMASAAKKQHRIKEPVRAHFNMSTGKFDAWIVKQVVAEVEDPLAQWTVEEALDHKPDAQVGDEILIPISTEGLGRIAAQSAKQVLYQRIREAEREKVYDEYAHRVGEIVNGTVRRFERGDIIVDLGRTEAAVPRSEQARHERYSQGDRVRAVIVNVHKEPKGPQVVLSRTDPRLLMKLFEMEVPEIYDGTVVIKNAVRAPGERAKVAVYSRERDVDPVGACVGMKGSRVQAIIRELRGEKIDIIEYSDDLVTFAQSALAPAKITRVSIKHEGEVPHLDVIVEDAQLSLAIGKRGQNVRLASELIGCKIDIKSESAVKDEVADALAALLHVGEDADEAPSELDLVGEAGIEPEAAEALRGAGYADLQSIADASAGELAAHGLAEEDALRLIDWAQAEQSAAEAEEEAAFGDFAARAEKATASKTMGDADFMAALSRAFQDLDVTRGGGEEADAGVAGGDGTIEAAESDGGPGAEQGTTRAAETDSRREQ